MAIRLPPLPSLRLFEAAGRHESFRRAADELGLTASAVSHGIDSLEKFFGVALFRRSARGVALTPSGRYLLPFVSEGLSMIALGAQRLPGRRGERAVVLSVAPTFAQRFLVERLPKFRKLHPGVRISVDTSHRQALFPMDGVDLSIRIGKGAWPGVKSELLFRERLVPLASPDYVASVTGKAGADWARTSFIHISTVENDWDAWIEGAGLQIEAPRHLQFDTIQLASAAAAAGLGVVIGRLPLIAADLRARRLVKLVDKEIPIDSGYWLVGPSGQETRPAVQSFRKWLLAEARQYRG
jgi:DNA-binding transcriptional LysR family regulator